MAFGPYEEGELFAVPDRPTEPSRRWRQRGAVALRCGEKSSHQKTGLEVGSVKSAVADPADVLAAYVSKMWSQARNSLALDGLSGIASFGSLILIMEKPRPSCVRH